MRILRGPWGERLAFLLAAALLFLGVFAWQPAIYGNDGAAIQRYVQRDRSWGGRVQVLAVEDQAVNASRCSGWRGTVPATAGSPISGRMHMGTMRHTTTTSGL